MWLNLILFLVAAAVLGKSGAWVVTSLAKIARFLKMSDFVIGFIIMGFATSLPELFVGITGSIVGASGLVLGNIIGSNIANIGLVLGIGIILARGINVKSKFMRRDVFLMFLVSLLPLMLMLDQELSRFDGGLLIFIFIIYMVRMFKQKERFRAVSNKVSALHIFNNAALLFISLILLIGSAHFVVKYATLLSVDFGLPEILIGLFLVAIGTSLPELVFTIKSILREHHGMSLGNIVGSVVINITFVLGVCALIRPISADFLLFVVSAGFMIMLGFILLTFVESEDRLSLYEGLSLLFIYLLFIIVELSIKGIF